MRVVVMGGSGFLGRRVMQALQQAPWAQPVAVSRSPMPDIPSVVCDAMDPASLAEALSGADGVVNCIATGGEDMLAATVNMVRAADAQGIRRIVHLSSMAVYDEAEAAKRALVDEETPLVPCGPSYGGAKVSTELLLQDYEAAGGELVILRPSCIYGPGSQQWTGRIGRLLRDGRLGDLGEGGQGTCNLVHINDVTAAVLAALRQDDVAGQRYNISSGEHITWNEYLRRFGQAIGAPAQPMPSWRLAMETRVLAPGLKLAEKAGWRGRDAITPAFLRSMRRKMRLDTGKADRGLRYERTSLEVGLQDASAWFLQAH